MDRTYESSARDSDDVHQCASETNRAEREMLLRSAVTRLHRSRALSRALSPSLSLSLSLERCSSTSQVITNPS